MFKHKKSFYLIGSILILIFILLLTFACIYTAKYFFYQDNSDKFDNLINNKAEKYCLEPNLVKALIWRESDFNINATGAKGEIGLMQIMPNSAVLDWENYYDTKLEGNGILFNPELNVEIGCWYLAKCRRHWRKYSEPELLMLAEYNAGYSNVKKWLNNCDYKTKNLINKIRFKSTRKYVENILNKYSSYNRK